MRFKFNMAVLRISSPWDNQKSFLGSEFPKSSAVSPWSHPGVTLSFPGDTRSQLCPTKEGAALGGGTMLGIKWVPSVCSQCSRAQLCRSIPPRRNLAAQHSHISHFPSPTAAGGVWWARLCSQAKR